jgi:hypothetical protein
MSHQTQQKKGTILFFVWCFSDIGHISFGNNRDERNSIIQQEQSDDTLGIFGYGTIIIEGLLGEQTLVLVKGEAKRR